MNRTRDLAQTSSPLVRVVLTLFVAILLIGITGLQRAGASSASNDKDHKHGANDSKGGQTVKPQASSGSTSLYTLQGSGAATSNGDYISADTGGLNTSY